MDQDILQDYLPEARELLEQAQADALRLESAPDDPELLASLFRAFHTLKGGAGFLEAEHLVDWTHHLEDLLDKLRSGSLRANAEIIDAILQGMDVIQGMLEELFQNQNPQPGPSSLGDKIRRLAASEPLAGSEPLAVESATLPERAAALPSTPTPVNGTTAIGALYKEEQENAGGKKQYVERKREGSSAACPDDGTITDAEFEAALDALFGPGQAPGTSIPEPAAAFPQGVEAGEVQEAHSSTEESTPSRLAPRAAGASESIESTLRVEAKRLDAVMNQVGELVLLRNRLSAALTDLSEENEGLMRLGRELDLTVNDLQNTAMRLRMQPCKRLFQNLPRVVRDTARELGKKVTLRMEGEDVEIDKTVIDGLSAPIVHLVRNALDHGLETPEQRRTAHKPETAVLTVAAKHLGDKVRIEVQDDGQGIEAQRVLHKAIEKGIITAEQAAHLSEAETLDLIFRPGFSTNDTVTDISGRGVGMDVVRESVRKLRGKLDLQTQVGEGTRVAMEFPLTLAILPVLYIRLRRETYALPISIIESLMDIAAERRHQVSGNPAYWVTEGRLEPWLDLGQALQNRPLRLGQEPVEGLLTDTGVLVVSEVLGNEDSVVKPMDFLPEPSGYQGATISGKGRVVPILDVQVLGQWIRSQSMNASLHGEH